jgi:hypothetical protein
LIAQYRLKSKPDTKIRTITLNEIEPACESDQHGQNERHRPSTGSASFLGDHFKCFCPGLQKSNFETKLKISV